MSLPASQHHKSSTSFFLWFGTHLGPQASVRSSFSGSLSSGQNTFPRVNLMTSCSALMVQRHSVLHRTRGSCCEYRSLLGWTCGSSSPSCRIVCTQIDILCVYYFIDEFVVVFSLYVTYVSISQSHSVRVCSTRTLRAWGLKQTYTDPIDDFYSIGRLLRRFIERLLRRFLPYEYECGMGFHGLHGHGHLEVHKAPWFPSRNRGGDGDGCAPSLCMPCVGCLLRVPTHTLYGGPWANPSLSDGRARAWTRTRLGVSLGRKVLVSFKGF